MKQALIYPSTGDRFVYRGGAEKTKTLIANQGIGKMADKPHVLKLFEIWTREKWQETSTAR